MGCDANKVLINVVLDRSGSMSSIKDDMIGGFAQLISDQRKLVGQDVRINLFKFDHMYEVGYKNLNLWSDEVLLNHKNFEPRGSTSMYDGICRSINEVGADLAALPESSRPARVVFIIITDGYENSSKEYDQQDVARMIKEQETKYSWEFVYLGANQDAIKVGAGMGLSMNKSYSYSATQFGTQSAWEATSKSLQSYRAGVAGQSVMSFQDSDREENKASPNV